MNNGELVFEDMRMPEDHLLVESDALGKAGVYFRPGKIIQAAKNLGVGMRAYEAPPIMCRTTCRAAASSSSTRPWRCGWPTWRPASRRCARWSRRGARRSKTSAGRRCALQHGQVFASEEIFKVAQHAMELHGGNGAMLDFGVEKLFRDASIFLHMDATADISQASRS